MSVIPQGMNGNVNFRVCFIINIQCWAISGPFCIWFEMPRDKRVFLFTWGLGWCNINSSLSTLFPLTCVGGLVHLHWQLHHVIHPLCVLGFLRLLTHNPLLHQEPEGFRRVGPSATVPLWGGTLANVRQRTASDHKKNEKQSECYFTSTMFMKCNKNSWASCCRLVENSGWPRPTSALNIRGAMPIWSPCKHRLNS